MRILYIVHACHVPDLVFGDGDLPYLSRNDFAKETNKIAKALIN